ncbi:MAG: ferrous iron transport protein B [Clostridiales bacterium]|jgi:ferrous iron transport protein B|nr:ferrous iron transport protein B [Clostridiales bacterium]
MSARPKTVLLAGNPNVGKTSLYNRMTKSFEHVGNWHGVTVGAVGKDVTHNGQIYRVTDLPGFYSLSVYSPDEAHSRDALLAAGGMSGRGAGAIVLNVADANNLARNLYLTLQLIELGLPLVLVVNMIDELKKKGRRLDDGLLSKRLGVPVAAVSANHKGDAVRLMDAVYGYKTQTPTRPPYLDKLPLGGVKKLFAGKAAIPVHAADFVALKLLEGDGYYIEKSGVDKTALKELCGGRDFEADIAALRYGYIDELMRGVIAGEEDAAAHPQNRARAAVRKASATLDRLFLNKYLAFPLFLAIMLGVFYVTFGWVGTSLSNGLARLFTQGVYLPLTDRLTGMGTPVWMTALLGDGVVLGVAGVLKFLPQILFMFLFLSLLEDSGYLSRVAFMSEGLLSRLGLSGRSVFTMIMGFGCSAAAVLSARGLESDMVRKKTVLLTPYITCSAKLPVFAVIAGAYFGAGQAALIFALYVTGVAVALFLAFLFERCIPPLKSGSFSFILEMPAYRFPSPARIAQVIGHNLKSFLSRVGTVVFMLNVIVWALANFSLTQGYTAGGEGSILCHAAGFLSPLFAPLGFGNWRAVAALLSGIVAKEGVIAAVESLGGVTVVFGGDAPALSALCFMVFTLLYTPCVATIAATCRESGLKWTLLGLGVSAMTAYFFALLCRIAGLLFLLDPGLTSGVLLLLLLIGALVVVLRALIKRPRLIRACGYGCGACPAAACGKEPQEAKKRHK